MSFILNIHTATKNAIISIAENEKVLSYVINTDQKDHASFLQPAIKQLLGESNLNLQQMNAISVTAGPGSYTGLRVGMASAKGLCFALKIPLVTLNTLEVMGLFLETVRVRHSWKNMMQEKILRQEILLRELLTVK